MTKERERSQSGNNASCSTIKTPLIPSVCPDTAKVVCGNLDLTVGDSGRAVLAALDANPPLAACVTKVIIQPDVSANSSSHGNILPSPEEIIHLMASVGRICPYLEDLMLLLDTSSPSSRHALELPVAALTAFFRQAPENLQSLKISAVIAGTDPEFAELEEAIKIHGPLSWKDLRLEFCEPSNSTLSLDPLLGAIAAAPGLKQVTLSGTTVDHLGSCTGPSLVKLAGSAGSHLEVLTIWGGKRRLDTQDTCALIQALETNTCLKELTLHARGLSPTVGRALARCLRVNTSIERLVLSVSDGGGKISSPSDYVTTTTALADALRWDNRTLRMLSLDYSTEDVTAVGDSLDYDFYEYALMDDAAKALDTQAVTKAFTKMLHSNPVLEVLWMNVDHAAPVEEDDEDEEALGSASLLSLEMDMLLRLNRHGIRRRLFGQAPTASSVDWTKALASQRDDLNALFYLMSKNPSLCFGASESSEGKRPAPAFEGELRSNKKQKRS